MDPRESKSQLRQAIKDRLARLTPKDRANESRSLCRRILQALPKEPTTVCGFYPMGDETDIREALTEVIARGHALYLPRKEGPHFVFRKAENLDALQPDEFGIPAPADDAPLLEVTGPLIALVPGRAFDANGNRMGRGNGGYDIWIRRQRKENPAAQFFGIVFECQVVHDIPMEAHDEKVDAVITARGKLNRAER